MNLPNQISIARILFIPLFVFLVTQTIWDWGTTKVLGFQHEISVSYLVGAIFFLLVSLTDWLDGYLARRNNQITNLGKFLDPLADKLFVSAALIVLVEFGLAPGWIVLTIISREFAVTGLRLLLAEAGEVVAANFLGKLKTVSQIVAIVALFLHELFFGILVDLPQILLWVALFLTIWSGIDYFIKNKHAFAQS